MDNLFWFILSKDRPLQLDALLRSMQMMGASAPCAVLYKTSNERYRAAYAAVFERHRHLDLDAVAEQDFKADVFNIIRSKKYERVAFLVDDQVFVAPVNLRKISILDPNLATYSFRLGKRIVRSQPLGNIPTEHPPFLQLDGLYDDWLAWHWAKGKGDWAAANSVDGNVLSRAKVLQAFEHPLAARISGPQTLEMSLHGSGIASVMGVCSTEPQLINLAINRVSQEQYWYPHGSVHADQLLDSWEAGYQMALQVVQTFTAESCHLVCDLPMHRREA